LRLNDHRGGWKDCSLLFLLGRLHDEVRELNHAIGYGSPEEIGEEAADAANFAMMIADVVGALGDGSTSSAAKAVEDEEEM